MHERVHRNARPDASKRPRSVVKEIKRRGILDSKVVTLRSAEYRGSSTVAGAHGRPSRLHVAAPVHARFAACGRLAPPSRYWKSR